MQYDAAVPQPPDIPATDSQDQFLTNFGYLSTFWGINHVAFGNVIVNAAPNATTPTITTITSPNHGLPVGASITPSHMNGRVNGEIISWTSNGNTYAITIIDANSFTIPFDSRLQPEYIANSGDFSSAQLKYGYHTQTNYSSGRPTPNLVPPAAALFPQLFSDILQMVWQNDNLALNNPQLTGSTIEQSTDPNNMTPRFGMRTPWGLIINWGLPTLKIGPVTNKLLTYQIPFVNPPYTIIMTPDSSNTANAMFISTIPGPVTNTQFYAGFNLVAGSSLSGNYIAIGT